MKTISDKRYRTLNAKSNQVGLDTKELLDVLQKSIPGDNCPKWRNKR